MAYGSVLTCEQDTQCARKKRGAFFTPPELADFLSRSTIASATDKVFEPSCGEAEFLRAAFVRLRELGSDEQSSSGQLFGCELHEDSVGAALKRMRGLGAHPTIETGDFFDLVPTGRFDAVVGNPPYVRYQEFSGTQRAKALAACQKVGVDLSSLTSSWAPFVVLCAHALRKGGALGLVLPAELLTVNYAAPVRKMLLDSFESIELTLFERRVFPEVQEEVVALVARNFQAASTHELLVRHAYDLSDVGTSPLASIPVTPDGSRWSQAFVQGASAPAEEEKGGRGFCDLSSWGVVFLGAVTGNNTFFALTEDAAEAWGLGESDCVPLIPPGSTHLRRLRYDAALHASLAQNGMKTRLFLPMGDAELSDAARRYIAHGEATGVSTAYKCRKRNPWWRVPLPQQPSDLVFTYMNAVSPQLCSNDMAALHLNSVHGVRLHSDVRGLGMALLPLACVNTFSALSAELNGRPYGGGILKMEPREAARFSVPAPGIVRACAEELGAVAQQVACLLDAGNFIAATHLVNPILQNACDISDARLEEARATLAALQNRRRERSHAN